MAFHYQNFGVQNEEKGSRALHIVSAKAEKSLVRSGDDMS